MTRPAARKEINRIQKSLDTKREIYHKLRIKLENEHQEGIRL